MRVLVFSPYAAWTPHWETDLEVMENHLVAGDEVTAIICDRELEACDPNKSHVAHACLKCVSRRRQGMRSLSAYVATRTLTDSLTDEDRRRIDDLVVDITDRESLKRYVVDGFDIGYAVLSSLITWRRDSEVDLVEHADVLRRFLRSSYTTFLSMSRIIDEIKPDRIYLFNGRLAILRAALRAGQAKGTDVHVTEVGCDPGHYAVYENTLPHNIGYVEQEIHRRWDESPHSESERREIAKDWFQRRTRGSVSNDKAYTRFQDAGSLPHGWDEDAHNVVIFTSSEDEFSSIGDHWKNPMFADQANGIQRLAECTAKDGIKIHVRVHPNLIGIDNDSTRALHALKMPHVSVLPANSSYCSYELMRSSDTVLTFGSTMGIEAAFWGMPSVLVGHTFYENLGVTYNPSDLTELRQLIIQPLEARGNDGAYRYGYYWSTFGQAFQHYQASDLTSGEFKGSRIRPPWLTRLGIRGLKFADSTSRRVMSILQNTRRPAA